MDWDDVRVFLALARTGSFSAAARQLGVNHSTVARRIAKLHEDLGCPLVEPNGHGVRLTAAGSAILADAERMELSAVALRHKAEAGEAIAGVVRVSALPSFAERVLAPLLSQVSLAHPGLAVDLVGEDRNVSIERGDADIAVRFGRPTSGESLARRLTDMTYHLYAAPAYLEAVGPRAWTFIGFLEDLEQAAPIGRELTLIAAGRPVGLRCATLSAQREAAAAGGGIAFLPDWLCAGDRRLTFADGSGQAQWTQQLWLLLRPDVDRVARVRMVATAIAQAMSGRDRGMQ